MHRCTEKCAVNCEFSDNQCSICLGKHDNKSFVNGCFHAFCFVCLKEWSKVKNVCPLCKQEFKSILHNVKSLDDYEEYTLPDPNADIDGHPADGRFRYRTTMTNEWLAQREHQRIEREILSLLSRPSITTRNHWRRRRQTATSEHRRQIYSNGMFVKEVRATNGRLYQTRDISPEWFWTHPASTHRLVPWLNRELNVLMTSETDRQFVLDLILELIQTIDIQSEAFDQQLRSFLGRKTRHFIHEFYTFAKSPYDMIKYDQCAVYDDSSNPPEVTLSSNSDNSTDEMSDTEDAVVFVGRKHKGLFPGDSETPSQSAAGPSETATREQTDGPSCSYISENSATNVSRASRGHYTVCTAAASGSDNGSRTCAMSEMKAYSNILMPSTSYSAPSNLSNQRLTLPFEVLDLPSTSQTAASATAASLNNVSNEISVDSDSDIEIVQVEKNWGERSPILLSSGDDEDVQVISDDKKDAHTDSRVKSHAHHKSKKHKKKKHKKLKKRKERDEDYRKRRHKYDRSERARSSSSYDRERRKHSKTRRRKNDEDASQRSSSRDVREGHSSRKRTYDSESDDNYRKRRKEKHHSYSSQSTHSDNGHRHRHRERRERSQSHKHSPRKRDNDVANAAHPKNNVDIFFTCSSSDSGEPTKLKSVIGSKLTSLNVQTETKAETSSDKTSGNCSLADDSSKDHALNTNSQENTIEVNVIKEHHGKPAECDLTEYIDVEKVDIDDISCNGEVGDCSDMKSSFEDQTLPCAEPTIGDNDITMMDTSSIMPKSTDVEKVETGVANSEKVSEVKNGSNPDQSNKDTNDRWVDKNSAEYVDVEKDSSDDKRTVEKSDSEEIVCIKEVTASNIDAAEENHHDLQNANADDSSTSAKIAKKWKKNSSGHKN